MHVIEYFNARTLKVISKKHCEEMLKVLEDFDMLRNISLNLWQVLLTVQVNHMII